MLANLGGIGLSSTNHPLLKTFKTAFNQLNLCSRRMGKGKKKNLKVEINDGSDVPDPNLTPHLKEATNGGVSEEEATHERQRKNSKFYNAQEDEAAVDLSAADTVKEIAGGAAHLIQDVGHLGAGGVAKMNLLKKENRSDLRAAAGKGFSFVMSFTSDPLEDAIRLGVKFDESKIEVLISMITHVFFLAIFCTAIFIRLDLEQPYRMQYAMKEVLLDTEIVPLSNVFFEDIMNIDQIFAFASNVLVPSVYQQSFSYSGLQYPGAPAPPDLPVPGDDYFPYFFGDSSITIGTVRVRQVRSKSEPCTHANSTSFLSLLGECHSFYEFGRTDDKGALYTVDDDGLPLPPPTHAPTPAATLPTSTDQEDLPKPEHGTRGYYAGGIEIPSNFFPYKSSAKLNDDGPWQSPITLVTYDAGGYVDDLPLGVDPAKERLQQLFNMNFIDKGTRALFFDYTLYCPNNDQFLSARVSFEFLPSGAIVPFTELIPAALLTDVRAFEQDNSSTIDLVQVIFEFVLYVLIIAYLTRASDDIAQYESFYHYLLNPWNTLDMLNVMCFLAVIAIRVFWMILAAKFQYGVGSELAEEEMDDRTYVPLRLPVVYYSFGKTFFAFGTLLSFVKTFRYIGVSRRLSLFTQTVQKSFADISMLMLIFGVLISGFSVAFHVAFGTMNREYSNFANSALSLLLLGLGDFDAQRLRVDNPIMGMFLFSMYAMTIVFVVLTMMLKIVDSAFTEMRESLYDIRNQKENLALQMRLAVRKIIYDRYWGIKLKAVIRSAQVTEKMIEKLNASGKTLKDAALGKKDQSLLDDSVMDMIEGEKKEKEEAQRKAKEEGEKKKAEEKKAKKKKLSRQDRKKRKAARNKIDTNLPENRRLVRTAIKEGRIKDIKEDMIDQLEVTDRLDMMTHRSDILMRSAQRLLDQVLIMVDEAGGQVNLDNDALPTMVKKDEPPYGKTGEMFGLRGVRDPDDLLEDDKRVTDLEDTGKEHYVMKVPKMPDQLEKLDDPKDEVTGDDIDNMYSSLGFQKPNGGNEGE